MGRCMRGWMGGWMVKVMDKWRDGWVGDCVDGWGGWIGRVISGWMMGGENRWVNGCVSVVKVAEWMCMWADRRMSKWKDGHVAE